MNSATAGILIGLLIGAITTLLIYLAAVVVERTEVVLVFRFGELRTERPDGGILGPGLGWVNPLLDRVRRYSTLTQQDEFPAEPELVEKEHEDSPSPGKKQPFRIMQTSAKQAIFYVREDPNDQNSPWKDETVGFDDLPLEKREALENDPVSEPITTEVQFVVEWKIDKSSVVDFATHVKKMSTARKRLEDEVARALQEYLGPITAGHAQEVMSHISSKVEKRLRIYVGLEDDPELLASGGTGTRRESLGITIRSAYIKSIDPGKTVNKARADAAASVGKRREAIEQAQAQAETLRVNAAAEAYKIGKLAIANNRKVRLDADADAYKQKRIGEGERDRIKAMQEAMETPYGLELLRIEAGERTLSKVGTTVLSGDVAGIIGSLTRGAQAAASAPRNPPEAQDKVA